MSNSKLNFAIIIGPWSKLSVIKVVIIMVVYSQTISHYFDPMWMIIYFQTT